MYRSLLLYRHLLLGVLCVLCATKLGGVVFQNISNAEDSLKAVRACEPFSSQTCLVKVKQPNGEIEGGVGILMDSQHVLVSGPWVMDPAKITVRLLEGALEETESSTTSPEGPLPVQEVFSLATPSKMKWGWGVKSLAKELDRGSRFGVGRLLSVKAINAESSFGNCRFAVHIGPNLALLRLRVPVKAWVLCAKGGNDGARCSGKGVFL